MLASNGKAAIELLKSENFDCVLSDVQMPVMSGRDLALWVKQNLSIPVILMSGYVDKIDTSLAIASNACNLIIKPFETNELLDALNMAFQGTDKLEKSNKIPENFVVVPLTAISPGVCAEFNLYDFEDGHLRKLVTRGEFWNFEKIKKTKDTKFYTESNSLTTLVSHSILVAKASLASSTMNRQKRDEIIEDAVQVIFDKVGAWGVDASTLQGAVEMITIYMKAIDEVSVWSLMSSSDGKACTIYAQSLVVTSICLMIAHRKNLSTHDCIELTTAALFHNIGLRQINPLILETPKALRSMRERIQIEKHVEEGVMILKKGGIVSPEVCEIIHQHHENFNGSGYPQKLIRDQIYVLARILRVADELFITVTKHPGHPGMTPLQAIERLKTLPELDQDFVNVLAELFNQKKVKDCA